MDKAAKVDALIAQGVFNEDDRAFLSNLCDDRFSKVCQIANVNGEPTPTSVEEPPVTTEQGTEQTAAPQGPAPDATNAAAYIAAAPAAIKAELEQSLLMMNAHRKSRVDTILKANGNKFTSDQLIGMETNALEGIAALVAPGATYAGRPVPRAVGNAADDAAPEVKNKFGINNAPDAFAPEA